jgi:hypothetical protein
MKSTAVETLEGIANQLRIHSIQATTAAGSGHPTSCCSAAELVAVLFFGHMRFDPKRPRHPNNDRFILSKGHAAPLLYAAWAEAGDDLMERNRWRYRLRSGARMEFTDNLRAGVQLETGSSGRSSNVTFGDDAGPWGKSTDGIFLGLLYLNWTPTDWLDVTGGRQVNPFKVTSLVWDGDLAPEGLTETFKTKAGKFDLFATFG